MWVWLSSDLLYRLEPFFFLLRLYDPLGMGYTRNCKVVVVFPLDSRGTRGKQRPVLDASVGEGIVQRYDDLNL